MSCLSTFREVAGAVHLCTVLNRAADGASGDLGETEYRSWYGFPYSVYIFTVPRYPIGILLFFGVGSTGQIYISRGRIDISCGVFT